MVPSYSVFGPTHDKKKWLPRRVRLICTVTSMTAHFVELCSILSSQDIRCLMTTDDTQVFFVLNKNRLFLQVPVSDEACEQEMSYKDIKICVGDFVFLEPRWITCWIWTTKKERNSLTWLFTTLLIWASLRQFTRHACKLYMDVGHALGQFVRCA